MKRFLGLGECMIELSSEGGDLWRQNFAGDVLNTLWYARAILPEDWQVEFHTGLGVDPISEDMLRFFADAGIICRDIPRLEDRTPGLYAIHLDGAERSFSYWRDRSAARRMLQDPDLLWEKVARADLVFLSGITLAILDAADQRLLISQLRRRMKPDAMLAFDPNIRARLWEEPEQMRQVITAMAAEADIVLPSFDDEQASFADLHPQDTAGRYLGGRTRMVVVKNGERSALVASSGEVREFPVPPVRQVIDTTAAGDAFDGAFLATLAETADVKAAIAAAHRCAGWVIGTRGALIQVRDLMGRDAHW